MASCLVVPAGSGYIFKSYLSSKLPECPFNVFCIKVSLFQHSFLPRCLKAPLCCWAPVCPVTAACPRRRAWRSPSRAWSRWSGSWPSTRYSVASWNHSNSSGAPPPLSCCTFEQYLYVVPEVRRVEAQGAGGVGVSAVAAFLCREVRRGRERGRPQAVRLPQEFRWVGTAALVTGHAITCVL